MPIRSHRQGEQRVAELPPTRDLGGCRGFAHTAPRAFRAADNIGAERRTARSDDDFAYPASISSRFIRPARLGTAAGQVRRLDGARDRMGKVSVILPGDVGREGQAASSITRTSR